MMRKKISAVKQIFFRNNALKKADFLFLFFAGRSRCFFAGRSRCFFGGSRAFFAGRRTLGRRIATRSFIAVGAIELIDCHIPEIFILTVRATGILPAVVGSFSDTVFVIFCRHLISP